MKMMRYVVELQTITSSHFSKTSNQILTNSTNVIITLVHNITSPFSPMMLSISDTYWRLTSVGHTSDTSQSCLSSFYSSTPPGHGSFWVSRHLRHASFYDFLKNVSSYIVCINFTFYALCVYVFFF